jgi:hypothetical protein
MYDVSTVRRILLGPLRLTVEARSGTFKGQSKPLPPLFPLDILGEPSATSILPLSPPSIHPINTYTKMQFVVNKIQDSMGPVEGMSIL